MKQIKSILLLAVTATLFFAACKKSNSALSIIGTWTINSMESSHTITPPISSFTNYDSIITLTGKSTFTFKPDGSYALSLNPGDYHIGLAPSDNEQTGSGTYAVNASNTQLYMTYMTTYAGLVTRYNYYKNINSK